MTNFTGCPSISLWYSNGDRSVNLHKCSIWSVPSPSGRLDRAQLGQSFLQAFVRLELIRCEGESTSWTSEKSDRRWECFLCWPARISASWSFYQRLLFWSSVSRMSQKAFENQQISHEPSLHQLLWFPRRFLVVFSVCRLGENFELLLAVAGLVFGVDG